MVANISTQSHGHANYNEVIITEIKSHINLPALINAAASDKGAAEKPYSILQTVGLLTVMITTRSRHARPPHSSAV